MRLVADRFVTDDRAGSAFARDLATQRTVWLDVSPAGDAVEQRRWTLRCDELFQLRHPSTATLVDYGLIGSDRRFEAWDCRAVWVGDGRTAQETAIASARFLNAVGLSTDGSSMAVLAGDRGAVARPIARGGCVHAPPPPGAHATESDAPGLQLVPRPPVGALCEILHGDERERPRAAALWGLPGSGLTTAVLVLARAARIRGFIPVDASALGPTAVRALADRSLFVISRDSSHDAARALVHAAIRSPRPHVCLVVGREEVAGLDGFDIGRVERGALMGAVRPASEVAYRAASRAADRARGLPGVFARLFWAAWNRPSIAVDRRRSSRIAEQVPAYGAASAAADVEQEAAPPTSPSAAQWPIPAEVASLRRKIVQAEQLLAAGRHSPGLRLLRQSTAALARRHAWSDAARGGLVLACELLTRGRARDVVRVLDEVRESAAGAADVELLSDVALLAGHAWIDLARLGDAETVLRAALTGARAISDSARVPRLLCALSRCLFWRGEFADGASLLENAQSDEARVTRLRHLARTAAVVGDATRALALLDEASREANRVDGTNASVSQADVDYSAAIVRLVIGDLEGVDRAAGRCIAAARGARRPMRLLSALLLQAEADRRRGLTLAPARGRMLDRMMRTGTPLLKLRCELLKALSDGRDASTVTSELAAASGVKALAVFASARGSGSLRPDLDPLVREMVEIVHVCHDADEERVVLRQVCTRIRQQLHAAAVAFVAREGGRWDALAGDGARIEPEIAQRVVGSGVLAGPCRVSDRLEAGAPVQYGGIPIAALCARWTPGAADELARAAAVLSVAASAAAPIVHAALAHRDRQAVAAVPDLIGGTAAMSDLRRAVERAAAAPFPVLIEGESGSGKELVARGIHRSGSRRDRPFCTLNCAALPDDLVESELFGHAKGSFTGAMADRPGVFDEAHGGTLFLDEVGELSLRAQAKLLRVIQEGELRRLGENISRRIDVRIVCATNRDLRRDADAGRFRVDLLYRLDVIRITVPPLRERREDVAALVEHFWADATRRIGSRATLGMAARALLGSYDWPGNVRELQNVLAALAVRSPKRGVVPPHALPPHIAAARRPDAWRLDAARRTFEEAFVRAALVRAGGHRSRAADELGLTRQGLNKLMSRLGID